MPTTGVEVRSYQHSGVSDPMNSKVTIAATFDPSGIEESNAYIDFLIHTVAEKIAQRYFEEHYIEIAAKLDQQAIANLSIAYAGKKIAEEIRSRPVVLRERTNILGV